MTSTRQFVVFLVFAAASTATDLCFGQSTFLFRNHASAVGLNSPVFDSDGNRLSGPDYVAVLYGGPTPDALTLTIAWDGTGPVFGHPMPPVPFTYMPQGQSGYFLRFAPEPGTGVVIPTVIPGGLAWLQVRAWDMRLGASYEEVLSMGLGGYGESNIFLGDGGNPMTPSLPGLLVGLESFSLRAVIPEPGSALLLLLGLPLLLLRGIRDP